MDVRRERPRVTVKYAQTLDGRIATKTGHSRWISGEESRTLAHRLRAEHDAILVGVGTVLADDPQLTVRLSKGNDPLRVVVDSALRTPLSATVLADRPENTVIATTVQADPAQADVIRRRGARLLLLPGHEGRVDLAALLEQLAALSIGSVLVEGGAQVISSFLRLRLADDVVMFIAPKIVGTGIEAISDLGIRSMDQAIRFERPTMEIAGKDIVFRGTIDWGQE
jgi:riboflavin-specific deaminase-like protein